LAILYAASRQTHADVCGSRTSFYHRRNGVIPLTPVSRNQIFTAVIQTRTLRSWSENNWQLPGVGCEFKNRTRI